jgi:sugar O-acyltransferase (sialic acid O-acetyltransferase NeuD family)
MLVIGAGGHASEVIEELYNGSNENEIYCFDEQTTKTVYLNIFQILKNYSDINSYCSEQFQFILGVGNPVIRKSLALRFNELGGQHKSIISTKANIGKFNVNMEDGVDVMQNATISSNVSIAKGTLINRNVSIHHDCVIGEYCEIAPNAVLLGKVKIGDLTLIGAGAIIMPGVVVGSNCIIGAGAVVTNDVQDGQTVKGIPAK